MGHARKEQITIFPTNSCNMRCVYCAANSAAYQDSPEKISIAFAKRGISDYFSDGQKHQIRYYSSGEPTEAMDVIAETWTYAHSLVGNRLVSEMQTNCCFDQNALDWIGEHISIVWASIDGWSEVQNKNRPLRDGLPSSDIALKNALQLREKTFVGIRITIVPETVDKQIELIEYFYDLGFRHISSEPVFLPVRNNGKTVDGPITRVDLKAYIKNYVDAWFAAQKMGVSYINSFMVNLDERVEYACRSCLPTPHLTTDGFVSCCDLGFYGETPLVDLIYGQYNPQEDRIIYFPEKIKKLRTRKCENMKSCSKCFAKENCGGGCLGRAYHETRDFYGVISEYCWATRYLALKLPVNNLAIPYLHP